MFYYIAKRIFSEKYSFLTTLIKRCDTLQEAVDFCSQEVKKWDSEGLNAYLCYDKVDEATQIPTGNVVGAQAVDSEFVVRHLYMIFATPSFMAGGLEGL